MKNAGRAPIRAATVRARLLAAVAIARKGYRRLLAETVVQRTRALPDDLMLPCIGRRAETAVPCGARRTVVPGTREKPNRCEMARSYTRS